MAVTREILSPAQSKREADKQLAEVRGHYQKKVKDLEKRLQESVAALDRANGARLLSVRNPFSCALYHNRV